jgi:hypothetical protein
MNINESLKKRILSKIEEGYKEGGRLVEMGEVALYPEPAPAVDPTVQGSGKTLQVDSDLLRDLLNWATSADAGSIDAVVAKAEEMGVGAPLTPAQLVDLTATAHTADPSNPSVACEPSTGATQGITSPVVPAGPVGPLSPVMASFMRRGNKVQEAKFKGLPGEDGKPDAKEIKVGPTASGAKLSPKLQAQLHRATAKAAATGQDPGEMTLYGNESDEHGEPEKAEDMDDHSDDQKNRHLDDEKADDMFEGQDDEVKQIFDALVAKGISPKAARKIIGNAEMEDLTTMYHELVMQAGEGVVKEDDIIDSDNEVITKPEQMGNKNPGVKADGGQPLPNSTRPIGKLNDPANMGGSGLTEDGLEDETEVGGVEGGVEDAAAAIAGGIADGLSGDTLDTDPEIDALPGEGIPQDDDDAAINAGLGEPVAPPMGEPAEGGEGLVSQVAALNARVAELEALLGGSEAGEVPAAEVEIGGEGAGEEGEEDELSIDNTEDEEGEEDGGEGEEADEDSDEEKEEDEAGEEDEEGEEGEEGDEEDVDGKKLFLGSEEEKKK